MVKLGLTSKCFLVSSPDFFPLYHTALPVSGFLSLGCTNPRLQKIIVTWLVLYGVLYMY